MSPVTYSSNFFGTVSFKVRPNRKPLILLQTIEEMLFSLEYKREFRSRIKSRKVLEKRMEEHLSSLKNKNKEEEKLTLSWILKIKHQTTTWIEGQI